MSIQRQKAEDKGIKFEVVFEQIGHEEDTLINYSPMINCDENRVMQVLLGIQSNALKFTQKGKVETRVTIVHREGT